MKIFILFLALIVVNGLLLGQPAFAQEEENGTWELCPEPMQALNDVPASAAQLQADIDRYTLCVSRAELLLQLEELRQKSTEGQTVGMNLPTEPLAPVPLTPEQTSELLGEPGPVTDEKAATVETGAEAIEKQKDTIVVTDIRGQNGDLVATLRSQEGDSDTARVGDTLTDGSVITSISSTQVMVKRDGNKVERLEWGK